MEYDGFVPDEFESIASPPKKRELCERCRRPSSVCWCPYLPNPTPDIKTNIVILQHPYEEKRCLSTTPMLSQGLPKSKCTVLKGTRFKIEQDPYLASIVHSDSTFLLFPGENAQSISTLTMLPDKEYNLVVLDGTWLQAKGLYGKNKFLHSIKKLKVDNAPTSRYVIRTQPNDECLSTLESVALALESMEQTPNLFQILTRPLEALCNFQLSHGAVPHQSKEYLIKNGLYKSQKDNLKQDRGQQKDLGS